MNKIYCASLNPNKVNAVKKVFGNYLVYPVENKNETKQPKSIEETIDLAYNRIKDINELGLKIGLEAGVSIIDNTCYLVNFGVLVDEDNNIYKAGGTFIPLPDIIKTKIYDENLELKDAIQELVKDKDINIHTGTIGYLTNDLVTREDIFLEICKLLKGQYLKRRGL